MRNDAGLKPSALDRPHLAVVHLDLHLLPLVVRHVDPHRARVVRLDEIDGEPRADLAVTLEHPGSLSDSTADWCAHKFACDEACACHPGMSTGFIRKSSTAVLAQPASHRGQNTAPCPREYFAGYCVYTSLRAQKWALDCPAKKMDPEGRSPPTSAAHDPAEDQRDSAPGLRKVPWTRATSGVHQLGDAPDVDLVADWAVASAHMSTDFLDQLDALAHNLQELDGTHRVPAHELFHDGFMREHTRFSSFQEMLDQSGFKVETDEDLEAIPDDVWELHVQTHTNFPSWDEMQGVAAEEWTMKKAGLA